MARRRGQGPPASQDRDQQILSRLAKIEHKVDALEQTHAFALRAEEGKHTESVRAIFRKSKRRAQVYLAADGQRSVQEIGSHLRIKSPNVSRELTLLALIRHSFDTASIQIESGPDGVRDGVA